MSQKPPCVRVMIDAAFYTCLQSDRIPRLILLGPEEHRDFQSEMVYFLNTATAACNPKAVEEAQQGKLRYLDTPIARMKADGCAVVS